MQFLAFANGKSFHAFAKKILLSTDLRCAEWFAHVIDFVQSLEYPPDNITSSKVTTGAKPTHHSRERNPERHAANVERRSERRRPGSDSASTQHAFPFTHSQDQPTPLSAKLERRSERRQAPALAGKKRKFGGKEKENAAPGAA